MQSGSSRSNWWIWCFYHIRSHQKKKNRFIWLQLDLNPEPLCSEIPEPLNHLANGWVFICELSGSGFESSCSHLTFRFRACFEQGVSWHSGNYRVWIHSGTHTWHDKNIQLKFICPATCGAQPISNMLKLRSYYRGTMDSEFKSKSKNETFVYF